MKRGEIVWDKLGKWILLLVLLIILLMLAYTQKENFINALESLKTALRFGG
jgi:hypothetical protein